MKRIAPFFLLPGIVVASMSMKNPCDHLYSAIFEIIVDPKGKLEQFTFIDTYNCQVEPVRVTISDAWKKTACVMHVLNELTPTFKEGESPKPVYTFFIFDSDRPDKVRRNVESGTSAENPIIYVRPEILTEIGSERDGSNVCDRSF